MTEIVHKRKTVNGIRFVCDVNVLERRPNLLQNGIYISNRILKLKKGAYGVNYL